MEWVADRPVLRLCINIAETGVGGWSRIRWWHQVMPLQQYGGGGWQYGRMGETDVDGLGENNSDESDEGKGWDRTYRPNNVGTRT